MGLFGSLLGRVFGGGSGAPPAGDFAGRVPQGFRDVPRSDATRRPGAYDSTQASKSVREGMIPVVSSWVAAMKWVRYPGDTDLGDLFVKFRSDVIVKYQSVKEDLYDDFFASSSKGRFVHRYLKHLPYSIVS